jgi:hypothetical protein
MQMYCFSRMDQINVFPKLFLLFLCLIFAAILYSITLGETHEQRIERMSIASIEQDLSKRMVYLHVDTPGYTLKTNGTMPFGYSAPEHGPMVSVYLWPKTDSGILIRLPDECRYEVRPESNMGMFVDKPSNAVLLQCISLAFHTYQKAFAIAQNVVRTQKNYQTDYPYAIVMYAGNLLKNDAIEWDVQFRDKSDKLKDWTSFALPSEEPLDEPRILLEVLVNSDLSKVRVIS